MQIISHRGYWREPAEKNSRTAFERTVEAGFGTETDVRDLMGRLVVAHDPPSGGEMGWDELLGLFAGAGLPLAVNVKADGLAPLLAKAFAGWTAPWFAFDMSGPETVRYASAGLPFYTRHSDVEPHPVLYAEAAGVWLDSFTNDQWILPEIVNGHLAAGKAVCVVSSELHGRDPAALWERLSGLRHQPGVTLCTDRPEDAKAALDL
jgi:glycerophosphoryl diester phosphodiesterase